MKDIIKTEKYYICKEPEIGDNIEIVKAYGWREYEVGDILTITSPISATGKCVFAYHHRRNREVAVNDCHYEIFTKVDYKYVGVEHIKKKLMGVPLYTKSIEKWEVLDSN